MSKITLVGITHIDVKSQDKVTEILKTLKPEAVCLELDEYRLQVLLENERIEQAELPSRNDIETIIEQRKETVQNLEEVDDNYSENFSSILEDIGFFEGELAKITNVDQPGKEMLVAYKLAQEMGAKIYLVDRSIQDISKVMEEEVSTEEAQKFQQVVDELVLDKNIIAKPLDLALLESSPVKTLEDLTNKEEDEGINLNEVFEIFKDQESLHEILSIFHENFPKLYSILLEDRNVYMTKQILKVTASHTNIVVILGYGHIAEVSKALKEYSSNLEIEIAN